LKFQLEAPFQPSGDQPQAIEALTRGLKDGRDSQVLMGVTGSVQAQDEAGMDPIVTLNSVKVSKGKKEGVWAVKVVGRARNALPSNTKVEFRLYWRGQDIDSAVLQLSGGSFNDEIELKAPASQFPYQIATVIDLKKQTAAVKKAFKKEEKSFPPHLSPWTDYHFSHEFVLGDPASLHVADAGPGPGRRIVEGIGRSIQQVPGGDEVSYTLTTEEGAAIRILDPADGSSRPVAPTLGESQDHAWTPAGTLLMAGGGVVHWWDAEAESWREATMEEPFDGTITRMAVSPSGEWLAFVGAR